MRVLVLLFLAAAVLRAYGQEEAVDSTNNGACDVPASTCTVFLNVPPANDEVVIIIASWGGQKLSANVADGVNRYISVGGPVDAPGGILRGQVWYAQNRGSPRKVEVMLSGPSVPGAFDGIFVQIIALKGLAQRNQLDPVTVNSLSGTGTTLAVGSQDASGGEMMWAVFLTDTPGTPWTVGSGWTEISGGEAVSESEYKKVSQGKPDPARAIASRSVKWIGFAFGFKVLQPVSN